MTPPMEDHCERAQQKPFRLAKQFQLYCGGAMHSRKHFRLNQKGQSMAEFSLVAILIFSLLAGIVDLGRAFFTFISLRDAAQEGALFGSLNPSNLAGIENRVRQNSPSPVDLTDPEVIVDIDFPPDGKQCTGEAIQVAVSYPHFPLTMPFLGTILGRQEIPLRAKVIDTILLPACP